MDFINKLLTLFCTSAAILSCVKEVDAPQAGARPQTQDGTPELCDTEFAGIIDKLNGEWIHDASVLVYDGVSENPVSYKVSEISDDGYCILTGQVYNTSEMYFALYPAEGFADFDNGTVTVSVPVQQEPHQENICLAAAVSSDNTLTFSPMASYVTLKVISDNIRSVSITAAEGEFLAGTYTTTVYEPYVVISDDVTREITFSSAEGNIARGEYYVQVLPGDYTSLNVKVTYDDGTIYSGNTIKTPIHLELGDVFRFGKLFDEYLNAPVINMEQVAFNSAKVSWPSSAAAKGYNVYLNGRKVAELDGNASSYVFNDLEMSATYTASLEIVGESMTEMSSEKTFKTSGIRMLDNGRHHVVIEWDEVGKVYNGTTGSGSEFDRGYYIGVYKDAACTQPVYEFIPYDAMTSRYYGFATSSLIGKVGGNSYWIPTRIALGSLDENTEYFVRLKTYAGFSFTYSGTTYTVNHPYGTSDWSSPVSVRTKPARQAASGEVIFADFDELSILPDRHIGANGTLPASKKVGDRADMRAITIGYTVNLNIDTYGIASIGTNESDPNHKDYYNGKYFNVDIEKETSVYSNYIIKEGYELAGWHFSSNVRPAMGTVVIDKARNRMIGTPALTNNLGEEPTLCVLTFDQCVFLNAAPAEDVLKIWIYRDGALSDPIHTYTVEDTAISWTDGNNYKVDYEWTTKSFPLSLKSGDAVLIGTNNETVQNYIAFDNFKIAVHEGSGSLEIPDWGNDDEGLEI